LSACDTRLFKQDQVKKRRETKRQNDEIDTSKSNVEGDKDEDDLFRCHYALNWHVSNMTIAPQPSRGKKQL